MSTAAPHREEDRSRSRRSPLVPAAVATVAGAVALAGWLGTRDTGGADGAAGSSVDDAAGAAITQPRSGETADEPLLTEAPVQGEAPAATEAPDPITVGGVELTPPPPAELSYPGHGEESWTAPLEDRDPDGPYALGEADAPVVLIIWSDFQCPFCRSWATETKPELMRFVEDGTLRMEWRDFPYLGPESSLAALGGRAAAEQDKFWEFHDAVFAGNHSPNQGDFTEESLARIATEAGLDGDRFAGSINTVEQQEAVAADQDEGLALGVMGTPAFMINGIPIRGAQPTPVFVQAVEDAAAARGR